MFTVVYGFIHFIHKLAIYSTKQPLAKQVSVECTEIIMMRSECRQWHLSGFRKQQESISRSRWLSNNGYRQ